MPYAFKVTAKQNIGGSKGIAKGMSVQCVEKLKLSRISTESRSRVFPYRSDILPLRSFDTDYKVSSAEEIFHSDFNRKQYFRL